MRGYISRLRSLQNQSSIGFVFFLAKQVHGKLITVLNDIRESNVVSCAPVECYFPDHG